MNKSVLNGKLKFLYYIVNPMFSCAESKKKYFRDEFLDKSIIWQWWYSSAAAFSWVRLYSLMLGVLCFSLCTFSHLPSLCLVFLVLLFHSLSLVHFWILWCNLPLSHSLSLSFKNALYYHACPAGKSCSFGEWKQGNGPALKQQTVYWHLLEGIVRPTL